MSKYWTIQNRTASAEIPKRITAPYNPQYPPLIKIGWLRLKKKEIALPLFCPYFNLCAPSFISPLQRNKSLSGDFSHRTRTLLLSLSLLRADSQRRYLYLALNYRRQVSICFPSLSPCMLTPPSLRLTHEDNKPGSGLVSLLVSPPSLSLTLLLS